MYEYMLYTVTLDSQAIHQFFWTAMSAEQMIIQPFYYAMSVLFRLCYDYSINLHFTTDGNMSSLSGTGERL